jgi:large subunit ribosomal protein L29
MKPQELRNMTKVELAQKVSTLKEALSKLRFQARTGRLEKPADVSKTKKDIARILTILREGSYAK